MKYASNTNASLQLYLASMYFTMTTITTVGFGDISGETEGEKIICIILMVIGVISFSFATGALSSIISNLDSSNAKLKQKLKLLMQLKDEYNLSDQLYEELRSALKFDHQRYDLKCEACRNLDETVQFMNELPGRLRIELAYNIHRKAVSSIFFFQEKPKDFIAFV